MRARGWRTLAELALLAVVFSHTLLCPFTKVEESFNMQAVHDMLVHRGDLASYDHHEFPGVVPRTFLGAAVVAAVSSPFHAALETFWPDLPTRLTSQVAVRLVLALMCWLAFRRFNSAAAARFGEAAATCAAAVWALQFHLPFYMSRALPNVFALCVSLVALEAWLRDNVARTLGLFTLAAFIFRCDILVLLAPLTLQLLLTRRVRPTGVVGTGLKWAIPSVMASVLIDSALWVWPESQVLLFNTVDNRSSEWGEMPFHWYLSSALPRALSGTALLLPLGLLRDPIRYLDLFLGRRPTLKAAPGATAAAIVDSQASPCVFSYVFPGVAMVALYSLLPHKELRFIFPALPLFNLAAGVGMSKAIRGIVPMGSGHKSDGNGGSSSSKDDDASGGRTRSNVRYRWAHEALAENPSDFLLAIQLLLAGVLGAACLATAATSTLATLASRKNYPGGFALKALHKAIDAETRRFDKDVLVHIDAEAAMSGVSRFGQRKTGVSYSKQEEGVELSKFDFIITGEDAKDRLLDKFEVRDAIKGFDGISLRRFWRNSSSSSSSRNSEDFEVATPPFPHGGRSIGGVMETLFHVSLRDKLLVMVRWFPPPPREDLV
ncbi:unnamed protein product [Scytosiphon promiscuus]